MTERRFTDKPDLDPTSVRGLPDGHPALVENRTLFPSTVVDIDESFDGQLLVSGANNRKLGKTITKGRFQGYALYGLSLEERATCPSTCSARAICYGNGMQLARRHRIVDPGLFAVLLEDEIRTILAEKKIAGLMVRLHVLGDFPNVEYVGMWADLLDEHPKLACYGYTHWHGTEIGDAIAALKKRFPDRFRIRWSSHLGGIADSATIVNRVPLTPRVAEGIVCPAQTDATACCASCGLCWEPHAKKETIVFIKHGPKSLETAAAKERGEESADSRPIQPISMPPAMKPNAVSATAPQVRMVKPSDLRVEAAYQRDLSGKSIKLIRKIVTSWDWAKFKPPICAETADGLVVIDGQHTAIAAATHGGISEIPVLVTKANLIERRAEAFVSHNRDRLAMTPAQIFYGDAAARNGEAVAVLNCVVRAGATIPRHAVGVKIAKPGEISAVGIVRKMYRSAGPTLLTRALSISVQARVAPISHTVINALWMILTEERHQYVAKLSDDVIAGALASITDIERSAESAAAGTGRSRFTAAAEIIADKARKARAAA